MTTKSLHRWINDGRDTVCSRCGCWKYNDDSGNTVHRWDPNAPGWVPTNLTCDEVLVAKVLES